MSSRLDDHEEASANPRASEFDSPANDEPVDPSSFEDRTRIDTQLCEWSGTSQAAVRLDEPERLVPSRRTLTGAPQG